MEQVRRRTIKRDDVFAHQSDESNSALNLITICNISTRINIRWRSVTHTGSNMRLRTHIPQNCTKIKLNNIQDRCVVPSLFVTNASHSITNKVHELSVIAAINKPSVVLVTESWLSSDTPGQARSSRTIHWLPQGVWLGWPQDPSGQASPDECI